MKSRRIFIAVPAIILMAALAVMVLAACDIIGSHSHNYVMQWDETYHWQECTQSGCPTKTKDKAEHSFDGKNVCTVCGYVKGTAVPDNPDDLSVAGCTYVFDHAELLLDGSSNAQSAELQKQFESGMSGATMTFSKDGTCSSTQSGKTSHGAYKQDGAKLTVTIDGATSEMTVTANSISVTSTMPWFVGSAKEVTVTFVFVKGSGQTPDQPSVPDDGTIRCKHEASNLRHITDSEDSTCSKAGWELDIYVCTGSNIDPHKGAYFCGKVFATLEDAAKDDFIDIISEETYKMECGVGNFASYREALPLAAHTPVTDEAVEATCVTQGKTAGSHCDVCGAVLEEQRDTGFAEHNYADEVRLGSASSDTIKTCSVCGKLENADIYYKMTQNADGSSYTLEKASGAGLAGNIDLPCEYNGSPVTAISERAFAECEIEGVTIPECVTLIGAGAFENCEKLASVTWNAKNCTTGAEVGYRNDINGTIFAGCTNLKTVTFGETVESIPDYAFFGGLGHVGGEQYLRSLLPIESVSISSSVTQIGERAFSDCTSLLSLTFAEDSRLATIKDYAFLNCSKLTQAILPKGITSLGMAFGGCDKLEEFSLPYTGNGSWEKHFGYVFQTPNGRDVGADLAYFVPKSLKTVILTGGSSVEAAMFENCENIQNITLPDSVTSVEQGAFATCKNLQSITVDEGNAVYCSLNGILYNAAKTEIILVPKAITGSVTIPEGVSSIGDRMFSYHINLTSIVLPNSITSIGKEAFYCCYKLVQVVNLSDLPIAAGFSDYGYVAYYAQNIYNSLDFDSHLQTQDEYTFYEDGETVYLLGYNGTATELQLPASFNGRNYAIGEYAFYGNKTITSVTLSDGVDSIGAVAFGGCTSLESVTIPDSVTSIGEEAFDDCTSLETIIIGNNVTSIGAFAFSSTAYYRNQDHWSGDILYIGKYLVEAKSAVSGKYTINPGTKVIADRAFNGCTDLTSVTIPDSVTAIGESAFGRCTSLSEIIFEGNSQLKSIGSYAFEYCAAAIDWGKIPTIQEIGSSVFYGYQGKSLTIPNSVTSIGELAFENCTSLESLYINDLVAWCNIDFGNEEANPLYYAHNLYIMGAPTYDLMIPEGVTEIKAYAFAGFGGWSINISNSVASIGKYAFCGSAAAIGWGNDLAIHEIGENVFSGYLGTSVTIPSSITLIDPYAFSNCRNLTSVTFDNWLWWKVAVSGDMESAMDVTVNDPVKNAQDLTDNYCSLYWKRFDQQND